MVIKEHTTWEQDGLTVENTNGCPGFTFGDRIEIAGEIRKKCREMLLVWGLY